MIKSSHPYHLKQTSSKDFTSIENDWSNRGNQISSKIYFLLCESCFWTASYLSTTFSNKKDPITHCPLCIRQKLESMPISDNEEYLFEYDVKRGVILEFKNIS